MSALMRGAKLAEESLLLSGARSSTAGVGSATGTGRTTPANPYARNEEAAGTASAEPRMTHAEFEREVAVQLEALKREAREQGLREGREAGLAKIKQEQAAQLEAIAAFIRNAKKSLEQGVLGLSDIGVEIVFEAVGKVVGRATLNPEGVTAIVREVVQRARDRSRLVIRVSRGDYAWLDEERARLLEGLEPGTVDIVADDRVVLGGCILETPSGNLDGRLETQLAALRDALLAARRRQDTEGAA